MVNVDELLAIMGGLYFDFAQAQRRAMMAEQQNQLLAQQGQALEALIAEYRKQLGIEEPGKPEEE